jgi:cytochrome bd-type quinol oxidase subunit 2
MRPIGPLIIVVVIAVIAVAGVGVRLAVTTDPARRARAREAVAAAVQYGLLFGFAAVAAAISAHGLVGFARVSMELRGPWPYLLWSALDGAAGMCAVLLMRRAARGESALAPRLAVWGLVTASALFNWTHAPDHPGARARRSR